MIQPTDIYSLSYGLTKLCVQHFGFFNSITYNNLHTVVEVLNFYTLNQLEQKSCPPLMQAADDEKSLQIPLSERERMKAVAEQLLPGHQNALEFAAQLKQLSEKTKDERLMNDCDRLAGQIDVRCENLESWVEDGEERSEGELIVRGKDPVAGQSTPSNKQVNVIE